MLVFLVTISGREITDPSWKVQQRLSHILFLQNGLRSDMCVRLQNCWIFQILLFPGCGLRSIKLCFNKQILVSAIILVLMIIVILIFVFAFVFILPIIVIAMMSLTIKIWPWPYGSLDPPSGQGQETLQIIKGPPPPPPPPYASLGHLLLVTTLE